MQLFMLYSMAVNLSVGAALLLAWQRDKGQPFTRWIGLFFMTGALWVPTTLLYYSDTPLRWLGGVGWCAHIVLSMLFLMYGASLMRGATYPLRYFVLSGVIMFVVLMLALLWSPRMAVFTIALMFSVTALFVAQQLRSGPPAEKLASGLLLLNALCWWISPIWGVESHPLQAQIVALIRLLMGLALLYACVDRSAQQAERLSSRFMRLTDSSHQGVVVLQGDRFVYANPAALRLFGLKTSAEIPPNWEQLALKDFDRQLFAERLAELRNGDAETLSWVQTVTGPAGRILQLRMTGWLTEWDGRVAIQLVLSDETDIREAEQRLIQQATHDHLTGTLNRFGIEQLASVSLRDGRGHALILINIDRFSSINDAFGYTKGDELLSQLAARMAEVSNGNPSLARISRDEFLLLLPLQDGPASASAIASRLLQRAGEGYQLAGIDLNITVSIGVALYPSNGDSFERLLKQASLAVKSAKDAGQNMIRFFDSDMDGQLHEEILLTSELHGAVQRNEFVLYLQPILDMQSGRVVGAEALIRWLHPVRGFVSPGVFIPIAEKAGLIVEIGGWVIDQACALLAGWVGQPVLGELTLAINVSAKQFGRGDLDQVLARSLAVHQAPANLLELEITESALINQPEQFVDLLARLRRLGVRLAIDDFGTGYSNLTYLQRFMVDKLKVDQSFVRDVALNSQNAAIVQAVVQMASSLGLKTTAEGIEDSETFDTLRSLGCDQAQGYLFSPPMPAPDFDGWVMRRIENGQTGGCS